MNSDPSDETLHIQANKTTTTYALGDFKARQPKMPKIFLPIRYFMAILSFLGFANVYGMRVNLSVAIVKMAQQSNSTADSEFDWDSKEQGIILSSFFWGYIVTQLPGGILAGKFGAKKVYGLGIFSTSVFTIFTPLVTHYGGFYGLLILRILEGLGEGVTYPAQQSFWSKWAPRMDHTKLVTISFCGSYAGTVLSMPLCGYLAETYGWESIFYVYGTIGVVWCIGWFLLASETPETNRFITEEETKFINDNRDDSVAEFSFKNIPWKYIATSFPVYAIVIAHFCENWGWYTLLTELPRYMNDILKFDLKKSGIFAAFPYLLLSVITLSGGQLADYLRGKYLSTVMVRRIFNTIGFASQMAFLLLTGYTESSTAAVVYLTLGIGLGGFAITAFNVSHLDVCPHYAGITMGISNTIATIPGIVSPTITGWITKDHTPLEWRVVFFISSGIYAFGMIMYVLLISGDIQSWNGM